MIHLDTSYLVGLMRVRSREASLVRGWIADGVTLATSAVAWAEFLCGPEDPGAVRAARRVVPGIVAFDAAEARVAARLFNSAGRRRGSMVDCMIAATAIRADAPLATSDVRDFEPFTARGLRLV